MMMTIDHSYILKLKQIIFHQEFLMLGDKGIIINTIYRSVGGQLCKFYLPTNPKRIEGQDHHNSTLKLNNMSANESLKHQPALEFSRICLAFSKG